ncbi:MAG: putative cofD-like protein [Acidimicrobiales bacterium]|jgi:uncharacterized cofD-like protein
MSSPYVVALGGGHGLASSLRAARTYAGRIAGIVSVADDGGSSGRIRRELGLPAPGDLRRCLSALASDGNLLARSLEHRFESGALEGHPVGNLLIAGLASASGDFEAAVSEVARLVGAEGTLHPATRGSVTLLADADDGTLNGQVTIERGSNIRNLRFDPPNPKSPEAAVQAIMDADQVIIGPGSLFTSVLAAAVVPAIRAALLHTSAQRIFVANIANERGEARGFDLPEHVETLSQHGVTADVVVTAPDTRRVDEVGTDVCVADVADDDGWGHDPKKLGAVLNELRTYQPT